MWSKGLNGMEWNDLHGSGKIENVNSISACASELN